MQKAVWGTKLNAILTTIWINVYFFKIQRQGPIIGENFDKTIKIHMGYHKSELDVYKRQV